MSKPSPERAIESELAPLAVAWGDAPERILSLVGRVERSAERRVLVGVCGPVASGKSTLARLISQCILSTDDYLPDYDKVAYCERDEPRHADFPRLARDLEGLRRGEATRVPVWSFQSHARAGEREVTPGEIVVCEGIHALHETVADRFDLKVFVDAPRAVRLERWEARERSGERGWSVEFATKFFHEVAEPTFERYEALYRARAHVIVANERR